MLSCVFYLYTRWPHTPRSLLGTLYFTWLMGAFLGSYIALAEAAKYAVADILPWIAIALSASTVQFTLFGLLLHLAYRKPAKE